jgi:hypothetical protein
MNHDELVFDALCYRRNLGANLDSIRSHLSHRENEKHSSKQDLEALARLAESGRIFQVDDLWFLSPEAYKNAKGSALAAEWKEEDAWILLTILYASKKGACKLEDVIALADGINKAVPTPGELHGALNRLAAGRLIKYQRNTYSVTESALALFAKVEAPCKKNLYDQLDGLRRLINCPCCGVPLKAVRWDLNIDQSYYDDAVESDYEESDDD